LYTSYVFGVRLFAILINLQLLIKVKFFLSK
jgi:hypothetical protein